MFKNQFLILLFLSSFLSCCTALGGIDKTDVESFINSVDQAFMQRDIENIERVVSDSARVEVVLDNKTDSYDKETYMALLKETWERADSYSYQKISSTIDIVSSTKALINEKVIENTVIGREVYSVVSDLVVEVQLVNGKLLATQLNAKSRLEVYANDFPISP